MLGSRCSLIARVDALRRVADEKVAVEGEARRLRQDRHANFFRCAGIDRRFVDHDIALREHAADCLARAHQGREVGPLRLVDRRRHGDDIEIAGTQRLEIGGEGKASGGGKFIVGHLAGTVAVLGELADAGLVDVEADDGEVPRHVDGERQPDIAKSDDADAHILEIGRLGPGRGSIGFRVGLVVHRQVRSIPQTDCVA